MSGTTFGSAAPPTQATVGELLGRLASEAGVLMRQEASLAAQEMATKARKAAAHAWVVVVGLVVLLIGAQTLALALVFGLSKILPLWLAALSIGTTLTLIGAIAIAIARMRLARIELVPSRTIQTLKEGATWAERLVQ